jgi:hypothetical protein
MALMQGNQGVSGKSVGQAVTAGLGEFSDLMVTELMPRYYENTYRGNKYFLALSAGGPTAFTGGAGGTPLLSIYNPVGSGKNLVLISASVAIRATAGTAGNGSFLLWGGVSVANSGTLTKPTNMLSMSAGGSVALGSSNAATTSTTAINLIRCLGTYYWATAASAFLSPINYEAAGEIVVAPGVLLALGLSVVPTSTTCDASMIWDELPI